MPDIGFKHSPETRLKMSISHKGRKRPEITQDLESRVLKYMDQSGGPDACWEWTGSVLSDGDGYGQIQILGSPKKAHRIVYELFVGPIPDGKLVCHSCDNKKCVNPAHLFIGTQVDNMQDMRSKGRDNYANGTKLPQSKLDPVKVRKIRELHAYGDYSVSELTRMFGVTQCPIQAILDGRTWKHVD